MYGIQWFKVDKNIFNNRKIQLLLKRKDGDLFFRIWIQLLSIAVECGNNGRLEIGEKPITVQHYAKIMGKTSDKIEAEILKSKNYKENNPKIIKVTSMQQAVETASNISSPGDIVALSPACASFDLYKDFEERGNHFKSLVKSIGKN